MQNIRQPIILWQQAVTAARPKARGRKIFGRFLNTGEETYYYRDKFIGAIKDEYIPEWAKEKLEEFNATAEEETEDMTMGGM